MNDTPIVDSNMRKEEILARNPDAPAPEQIQDSIRVATVLYVGFDERVHQGQIAMHKDVLDDVVGFFELARSIEFPIEKVIPISNKKYQWDDEMSCEDNNSSGYNYRTIHGTTRLSKHAQGLAFDINPVQNIYVKYDENQNEIFRAPTDGVYDVSAKGTLTKNHPLVQHMKSLGWVWGGDWTPALGREDYQHFEKPSTLE